MGFLIVNAWKRSAASMALLWFLAGFLLVAVACLNHAGMGFVIEPHWLYISSLGFFLLIAIFLRRLKDIVPPKMWMALIFILVSCFGILTQTYNALARTEKGYCEYWLERSPGNAVAILRLGELAYLEGEYPKAERHLRIALHKFLRPETRARISHNLGVIYKETGNKDLAVRYFRQAIAFAPDYEPAHTALSEIVP